MSVTSNKIDQRMTDAICPIPITEVYIMVFPFLSLKTTSLIALCLIVIVPIVRTSFLVKLREPTSADLRKIMLDVQIQYILYWLDLIYSHIIRI